VIPLGSRKYHRSCFCCVSCGYKLQPSSSFFVLDGRLIHCHFCMVNGILAHRSSANPSPNSNESVFTSTASLECLRSQETNTNVKLQAAKTRNLKSELHVEKPLSRGSFKRGRRPTVEACHSCESSSDEPEPMRAHSLQLIPTSTEEADLPGSAVTRSQPYSDASDNSNDEETRAGQRKASSRYTSPTLKRNRSFTASQILRKRLQRYNLNDTRRSSVELSSQYQAISRRADVHNCHIGDLSRSESMRIAATTKSGYPLCRVFREAELERGETLGAGFFATAVKVTHRDTNEVMVVKQLHSDSTIDQEAYSNFLKEVKVLRTSQHHNVLRFIGVLYRDGELNLVTEFIESGTLKELINKVTPEEFTWPKRIGIARDISAGLAYLHKRSITHRDLNSNNCLIKKNGSVVVADFGLAHWTKSRPSSRVKPQLKSQCVGSPFWMAPEMLNGRDYDNKIDIFSLGIILCEIIGRVDPDPDYFPRTNSFGVDIATFYTKFAVKEKCPNYFFAIAGSCCEESPAKRPSSQQVHSWHELLIRRDSLPKLPLPPSVITVRDHVFAKYNLQELQIKDELSTSGFESSSAAEDVFFSS